VFLSFFQCSVIEDTIVVREGKINDKDISVKLTGDPSLLCNDGDECKIRIDFEIVENKKKLPK